MGANGSSNAKQSREPVSFLPIESKLHYLQNKIQKTCQYHKRQSIMYCTEMSCRKCPYVCSQCLKYNVHEHRQSLHDHDQFVKAIIKTIEAWKQTDTKGLLDTEHHDYAWVIKEQIKIMEQIESLEAEISKILNKFKEEVQMDLNKNISQVNKVSTKKLDSSYIRFYTNPNILVNKIISDGSPSGEFIKSLKEKMCPERNPATINFTPQQEVEYYKQQVKKMKDEVKDVVNASTATFAKGQKKKSTTGLECFIKKALPLTQYPLKLAACGPFVAVSTPKDVYNFDSFSKNKSKIAGGVSIKGSIKSIDNCMAGVISPNTVGYSDGHSWEKVTIGGRITQIALLRSPKYTYGIFGQQDGLLSVIDMSQSQKTIFSFRCSDSPVTCLTISGRTSMILACGKEGPLHMIKYQSVNSEYEFSYMGEMSGKTIFPNGEIQLMRANGSELYLFGSCRNVVVLDLMLNVEIMRTQFNKMCPDFLEAVFVKGGDESVMVTLSENENNLFAWIIDKGRKTVKVDPLALKTDDAILSLCLSHEELWVVKDGRKQISIYTLNTIV